jgi:hypothetical protein
LPTNFTIHSGSTGISVAYRINAAGSTVLAGVIRVLDSEQGPGDGSLPALDPWQVLPMLTIERQRVDGSKAVRRLVNRED